MLIVFARGLVVKQLMYNQSVSQTTVLMISFYINDNHYFHVRPTLTSPSYRIHGPNIHIGNAWTRSVSFNKMYHLPFLVLVKWIIPISVMVILTETQYLLSILLFFSKQVCTWTPQNCFKRTVSSDQPWVDIGFFMYLMIT